MDSAIDLLLDAADGEDEALEGDFAGHGELAAHGFAPQQGSQRGEHCDPRRGAVLGDGAGGDVNVEVLAGEEVIGQAEAIGVRVQVGARGLHRFLHHVAELAGQGQAALALGGGGFDEEDIAAGGGPGEADDDAGFADAVGGHVALEVGRAQVGGEAGGVDAHGLVVAFGDLARHLAADAGDRSPLLSSPSCCRGMRRSFLRVGAWRRARCP